MNLKNQLRGFLTRMEFNNNDCHSNSDNPFPIIYYHKPFARIYSFFKTNYLVVNTIAIFYKKVYLNGHSVGHMNNTKFHNLVLDWPRIKYFKRELY